jgi:uncharacterized YigZ family protein
MRTIRDNIKNEIIIKNSKFIALLYNINDETEVSNLLDSIKIEYKNANHYCYAYIIGGIKRYNDDGEPSGTAGAPILNTLEKNDLNGVLCVVVRCFGGIKLGAGGLIRAYSKSVREALSQSTLVNINECYYVSLTFTYDDLKDIDFIINKNPIVKKEFNENIEYTIMLKEDNFEIIDKLKLSKANIIEIKKDYYLE